MIFLSLWWAARIKRFVVGVDDRQVTLFSECPDDWVDTDNPVRVAESFARDLDLTELGVCSIDPNAT
jgi:hypothetical protein